MINADGEYELLFPETTLVFTLSTAHMSRKDADALRFHERQGLTGHFTVVGVPETGWLVRLLDHELVTDEIYEDPKAAALAQGFSPEFYDLLVGLFKSGAGWVCFDCDGPILRGKLPVFEW